MTVQWHAEAVWEAVSPQWPSFSVEVLPEIDSTNTELMRRARAGQLDPILLVAERQTAGRGRLGRDWKSDTAGQGGTLTFSLGVPLAPADWSGLSLAVGLAVVQSLHPDLCLKWPNDVWLGQRKLAGILIETVGVGDIRYAVIGVGINLSPRDATDLRTPPAALQELLPEADGPLVLGRVVPALARMVQRFADHGFAPLRDAFQARDLLFGQEVVCSDGTTGTARGVDAGGALLVHTAQGLITINSAEVSVRPAPAAPLP
ncbi:biotin--[acetyl-CoA-carboxylase] ligase [uncultured Rhodoferax sp.]|uniref:biotin--[acetyl-CoA-carboxylase] ligase n=1 Tax=uncultured Rhodoferax sp. TaxID=223188 RepID=UPI0025D7BB27|nr:biotin--[acetyl-CoA-carboxylase] ligase [uncultured Rhodoferax sp.]